MFSSHATRIAAALVITGLLACSASAQSLDERLDGEQYLRGLSDLQLPEIVEHYLKTHPAANETDAVLQEIARLHAALAGPTASTPSERRVMIEALLNARATLIDRRANDPRRAVWLADQAADALFESWPLDASGLTALFGLPDAVQRERAKAVALQIDSAARQAEQAVDAAIRAVEASPGFARDVALQQRRRHLAEVERDRRIPFLRGVGAALHAELNLQEPAERQAAFELAERTLAPLAGSLEGPLAIQARLHLALALARLGRFDDAEALCATVARDPVATPLDAFTARMTGVLNRAANKSTSAALEGLASVEDKYLDPSALFYRVLIVDRRFLLRRDAAMQATSGERPRRLADAFTTYADFMNAEYPQATVSRDTLRAIVFARLVTAAATAEAPVEQLPPIVAIAQAESLASNAATRERAIVLLESLLQDRGLAGTDRAAALFILGRALVEHNQPLFAAQRFLELARDHATDSQAERAIELAATLAWDQHRVAPMDAEASRILHETLSVLFERYPNLKSTARWYYAAGRLAMDERRFDEAQREFKAVTPDAGEWLDANFMQAATARAHAVGLGATDAARPLHQATLETITRVQPLLQNAIAAADAARREALQYYLGMLRVYAAEAALALGDVQKALDGVTGIENEANIARDVVGEAMKVRINAYQSLRPPKPEEALKDLQQFVQNSPRDAGSVLQPMVASLAADVRRLIEAGQDEQAQALAERTLVPAAKTLETWLQTPDGAASDASGDLRRLVADAYLLTGEHAVALPLYEQLLAESPDAAELLLGKAECLFALGGDQRLADAMTIYKRLGAAGLSIGREAYWLSQLRMLEVLDRTNRNTHQIVPRIERLRQIDAEFGGERYRRGFEALRAKRSTQS